MKNIENKKMPILLGILAILTICYFTIIKNDTELITREYDDEEIKTTSTVSLFNCVFDYADAVGVCFLFVIIAVLGYLFSSDSEIEAKIQSKIAFLKDSKSKNKIIVYGIFATVTILLIIAFNYHSYLRDLEKENKFYAFNTWQASFLGFMKVVKIALPLTIVFGLITSIKKKKK